MGSRVLEVRPSPGMLHVLRSILLMGAALMGCEPDEQQCIEGWELWETASDGSLCVVGDLVVEGREPGDLRLLARVTSIDGALIVHDNPALTDFPEMPALTRVGGSLSFSHNDRMVEIRGFPALTEVGGGLYVGENPALTGFRLSDGVAVLDSLFVALNARLVEFAGVASLERIDGTLQFVENAALVALSFPALGEVGAGLQVSRSASLRSADFPRLRVVAGTVRVAHNESLPSLAGFAAIERCEMLLIHGNASLEELGLPAVEAGRIEIVENARLARISSDDFATTGAAGVLFIERNPLLQSIDGLAGVEELKTISVEDNGALREITGFSELTRVRGDLRVVRNLALEGPDGWFPALEEAGELWVFGNSSLAPAVVDAMLSRVTVGGPIRVGDNLGEATELDPCPWPYDGVCDGDVSPYGRGTELCAVDPEDCDA